MSQRNAKIRDALKTEYADFVDFCRSLDKQFISELTTSDFIAFRTQRGATRDYVASIRHALDSYDPDAEPQEEATQADLSFEEPAVVEFVEDIIAVSEDPVPEEASGETEPTEPTDAPETEQEPEIAADEPLTVEEPSNDSTAINMPDEQSVPETTVAPKKLFSSGKAWFNYLEELRSMDVELPIYDLLGIPRNPIFASRDVAELDMSVRPYNCLINNRCKTLDALFSKSLREISEFSNLGKKSLFEIVGKCKEIAANPQTIPNGATAETTASTSNAIKANEKLIRIAESITLGIEYDTSALCDAEKYCVALLEEAYQVLGEDLCLMALEEPDKARNLCSMLNECVERQEVLKQTAQIVNHSFPMNRALMMRLNLLRAEN